MEQISTTLISDVGYFRFRLFGSCISVRIILYRVEERGCRVSAAVERRETERQKDGMDHNKYGGGDPRPDDRE